MSWSTHVLLVTIFLSLLSLLTINHSLVDANQRDNLVVVTVATQITEGFLRFNRSVNLYGLKLEVLGLSQQWEGGDVAHRPGGGQKILLLKKYMESVKDQKDLIVLFTDSYDVVFNGGLKEILNRFHSFESKLVFSSEKFCWPDPSLESEYPKSDGKRFLNSGAFIGYAPTVYSIVSHKNIENDDDDQLYYTKIYLDSKLREQHKIKLDLLSELFQNLNGALSDVEIRFSQANEIDETNADASLLNKLYQTNPIIVHGNGNSKIPLNSLGNYLAKSWHPATGCLSCKENRISLDNLPVEKYPHVLIAVNILKPTPFFDEWLQDLESMDYPKERITLFIQTLTDYHSTQLEQFIDDFKGYYQAIRYKSTKDLEWQLRNRYLDECPRIGCDYLFVWDTEGRLTNPKTLRALIEDNKSVVAPLMFRNNELWSNFWGALTHDGFYSRAHDYVQIIKGERR
ncbi:hypothetical protein RDWZM_004537 [Blomia tropicalis]|uniref:PLOD1-3-like GT domain-containing protein n=1 Tax=Blomia tropicalis TaxID=40697 RepID=A0A9Q0RLQ7_BLOTA|nr:hypothetical protein RDWZM_004537 [Blomia tropicalis]